MFQVYSYFANQPYIIMNDPAEPLFFPTPTFLVRTPLFAIDVFYTLLKSPDLYSELFSFYESNSVMQEAILAASPSLFEALTKRHQSAIKQQKHLASSLLRYLSRMSTRPTPFGLFSFVSLGRWNKKTALSFDSKKIKKRARADLAWIASVLAKTCAEHTILPSVLVKKNPLAYQVGGRTYLNYIRKKNSTNPKEQVSVRNSPLIKKIFELTRSPVPLSSLEEKILICFSGLEKDKLLNLIQQLLTKQLLRLSIVPSLHSEAPLEDFMFNLEGAFGRVTVLEQLQNISKEIESYSDTPLDQGVSQLKQLFTQMQTVADSGFTPLQIDSACTTPTLTLNEVISHELSEASEILWRIAYWKRDLNPLKNYHSAFLNQYGSSRVVSLQEVLNADSGLGIPPAFQADSPKQHTTSEEENKFIQWLRIEYEASLYERRQEIELPDALVKTLTAKADKTKALLSFDLTCEVIANSEEDVDAGNYLLHIPYTTWEGGSTSGRFLDILGDKAKKSMQDLVHAEEALEPDVLFSDISFMPFDIRTGNVCIHPNLRKYAIDLDNPSPKFGEQLSLNDIYVGATAERLFLTLKGSNKELLVHTNHLYNPNLAPDIVRFLREVSSERYSNISPFFWGDLEQSFFLPRVKYKKVILCAAQWVINLDLLKATKKTQLAQLKIQFDNWADKWNMPRYVFMTVGDKRILLDRKQAEHLHEISAEIQKGEGVKLVEKLGQDKGCWIQSERGSHVSEFTVSFIKNKTFAQPENLSQIPAYQDVAKKDRIKLPGSEWLYAQLYMNQESEDHFLSEILPPFVNSLLQQKIITQFYFIRYRDQGAHVRIRFRGDKDLLASQLLPLLHDWTHRLYAEELIHDFRLSPYEKEIERYGGAALIDHAERLFFFDSYCSIMLLKLINQKALKLPNYSIAALSFITFLKDFGFNIEEAIKLLSFSNADKSEMKGFREWKRPLMQLAEVFMQDAPLEMANSEYSYLKRSFGIRKEAILNYRKHLNQKENGVSMIESMMHMHCNRLLGTDHTLEKKARLYALQTLVNLSRKYTERT